MLHNDKGINPKKDVTLVNIYKPKIGVPKFIKQMLMNIKEKMENNTVSVGNLNTPLISPNKSTRQKINKESVAINKILNQMDLNDIFRPFSHKTIEYIFFSSKYETFFKTTC